MSLATMISLCEGINIPETIILFFISLSVKTRVIQYVSCIAGTHELRIAFLGL